MLVQNELYDLQVRFTLDLARNRLHSDYRIKGRTDAQLLRSGLDQLTQLPTIHNRKHLVLLRWLTILMEHLSPDHPDYADLHRRWQQARTLVGSDN